MSLMSRYLAREIRFAVLIVLVGFLGLFAFFDLVNELDDLGRGGYRLQHALMYVALTLPSRVYELMPVAALIGAIWAFAQLAAQSEFTAMRAAGMGRWHALRAVLRVGLVLALCTAVVGEVVAPPAERLAQRVRMAALRSVSAGEFRSGVWIKDTVRDAAGRPQRWRFMNIGAVQADGALDQLQVFEFDTRLVLQSVLQARRAVFEHGTQWRLEQVERTDLIGGQTADQLPTLRAEVQRLPQQSWQSELGPELIRVAMVEPARMPVLALFQYIRHLRENRQDASRYEMAWWRKLIDPLAVVVMMALALPFAYLQVRAGGIGYKVFVGIMIGIVFHFMNGLFTHLGLLNTWPAWLAVSIPSLVALSWALIMLGRVGRMR